MSSSTTICFKNMSRYVLKQRKYGVEESRSKKPRLDVLEAEPEKIKTEFVDKTKSSETLNPETEPFIETNEENQSPAMDRCTAKAALAAGATASEAGVAEFVISGNPELVVYDPNLEYKINMETEETAAEQAQRKMHDFTSTVTELCTGFTTSKKQIEELTRKVTDLESQIEEWKDQKASWDEKIKLLEYDRDEAREEAHRAIFEKCDLKKKLENATKEAEDATATNEKVVSTIRELVTGLATSQEQNAVLKKQVSDLKSQIEEFKDQKAICAQKKKNLERYCDEGWKKASSAISEMRDIQDKLEKASKEAEDAKASAKKARSIVAKQAEFAKKAVASTRKSYKAGLGNFVAYLANDEGRSLEDYVKELIKEITPDDKAASDGAVDVAGHEGDKAIKDEPL